MRGPAALGAAAVLTFAATGCASSSDMAAEAGTPTAALTQVELLGLAPGYGNALTGCHGTTRLYVVEYAGGYSGPPLAVVANDPTCGVPQ